MERRDCMAKGAGGQWRWLWLTFGVIAIDQLTKSMAKYYLSSLSSTQEFFWLNFVIVHNTGSAFGFLDNQSGWQLWLFAALAVAVSIGILVWLWRDTGMHPYTAASLALILGGALGNLYDRIVYGYVIDFIDVHFGSWHWPAFNMADSAITIGVILLLVSAFRRA